VIRNEDEEVIERYIIYSTLQNVISRKNRGGPLERFIKMGHMVGTDLHDIKGDLTIRKMKVMRMPTDKLEHDYAYMVFKNGWRSEHTMKKADIQKEVTRLFCELGSLL